MAVRLTYCGNVHPSETLDGWLEATRRHAVPVARARRDAGASFGLGAFWTAAVAHELATSAAARATVAEMLQTEGLELWTLNVFPFGGFHDAVVKTAVYRPDWADPRRLDYTVAAARAASAFAAPGRDFPLSTLPLGFAVGDVDAMASQLRACGRAFARIEDETGVRPVLALEPEPACLVESVTALIEFLERRVFGREADVALLRRHLGICIDLCHLAVIGEDPVAALQAAIGAGIDVPKVQVSSCIELRDPARHLERLLGFDEPRYLHQTVADNGARALDLAEVRERSAEFAAATRVRTHFHLPVFWDEPGPLGSTRNEVERFLRDAPRPLPLLEVETYTWSVLAPAWRADRDLVEGLVRELDWVSQRIRDRS